MGYYKQEYWSGLPISPPGDLPDPGFKTAFPALASGFFTTEPPGKPHIIFRSGKIKANRICQGPRKYQIQPDTKHQIHQIQRYFQLLLHYTELSQTLSNYQRLLNASASAVSLIHFFGEKLTRNK